MYTQIKCYNMIVILISLICFLVISSQSNSVQNFTLFLTNQLHSVYLHCPSIWRNEALWIKEYISTVWGREWTRWSRPKKDFVVLDFSSRVFIYEAFSKVWSVPWSILQELNEQAFNYCYAFLGSTNSLFSFYNPKEISGILSIFLKVESS